MTTFKEFIKLQEVSELVDSDLAKKIHYVSICLKNAYSVLDIIQDDFFKSFASPCIATTKNWLNYAKAHNEDSAELRNLCSMAESRVGIHYNNTPEVNALFCIVVSARMASFEDPTVIDLSGPRITDQSIRYAALAKGKKFDNRQLPFLNKSKTLPEKQFLRLKPSENAEINNDFIELITKITHKELPKRDLIEEIGVFLDKLYDYSQTEHNDFIQHLKVFGITGNNNELALQIINNINIFF